MPPTQEETLAAVSAATASTVRAIVESDVFVAKLAKEIAHRMKPEGEALPAPRAGVMVADVRNGDLLVKPEPLGNNNMLIVLTAVPILGTACFVLIARRLPPKPPSAMPTPEATAVPNTTETFQYMAYIDAAANITQAQNVVLKADVMAELDRQMALLNIKDIGFFYMSMLTLPSAEALPPQ